MDAPAATAGKITSATASKITNGLVRAIGDLSRVLITDPAWRNTAERREFRLRRQAHA
jgi:hypothetical protein